MPSEGSDQSGHSDPDVQRHRDNIEKLAGDADDEEAEAAAEADGHYTAPPPTTDDGSEFVEELPARALWIEGYGFDDDVFVDVVTKINRMFTDELTRVIADEPDDMTAKEAVEKAVRMREENREGDDD